MSIEINRANELAFDELTPLIAESESEGWRFVRRFADELNSGTNCFSRPGEALFVARMGKSVVGICGINIDPYASDETTGRVRRLYVLRAYRGKEIGRRLVRAVVAAAAGRFQRLRVRTENPDAGRLYERLGFHPAAGEAECTHVMELVGLGQSAVADRPSDLI